MTAGEAQKLLKDNGFILLNQKGSHQKWGKDKLRFTLIFHSAKSNPLTKGKETELRKLIKDLQDGESTNK